MYLKGKLRSGCVETAKNLHPIPCLKADSPLISLSVFSCWQVCMVETSVMHYEMGQQKKQYTTFRMGCEHYSLCKDHSARGPGPYGYSIITTFCCCSDVCEKADGVGRKDWSNCPMLWANQTQVSGVAGVWGTGHWIVWVGVLIGLHSL